MSNGRHIAGECSRAELDSENSREALIRYQLLDYVADVLTDASVGRRRRTSGLSALGALACFTMLARNAAASEPHFLSGLTVTGPTSCEDRAALEREVKRRSEQGNFAGPENAPVAIDVKIGERDDGLGATILIQRSGQQPATRVISAGNCQELLEGAALVIAVVLSGYAHERPTPLLHSEPLEARESRAASPTKSSQGSESPVADGGHSADFRVGGGAAAVLSAGIGPGPLPGIEAFLSVGVELGSGFPELRLGLRRIERSDFAVNDAAATFRLTSGVMSFCPLALEIDEVLSLRPCAVASYGELRASGENVENARSERHPFAGVGVGLWLEAALASAVSLEVAVSSEAALIKSRFRLDGETFHETSPLAGHAAFGLVLRL